MARRPPRWRSANRICHTTLRALENNFVINRPSLATHVARVRRRRIDPVLFIYTRCHSCKNQIVKDPSQQASTAASSVTTILSIVVDATPCGTVSRWWTEAESMPVKAEVRHRPRSLSGHFPCLATTSPANWPLFHWPSCGGPRPQCTLLDRGETGNLTQQAACVKGSCRPVLRF